MVSNDVEEGGEGGGRAGSVTYLVPSLVREDAHGKKKVEEEAECIPGNHLKLHGSNGVPGFRNGTGEGGQKKAHCGSHEELEEHEGGIAGVGGVCIGKSDRRKSEGDA